MLDLAPGGAIGAAVFGCCALLAVRPIRSPRWAGRLSWATTAAACEIPLIFLAIVVASTGAPALGGVRWPGGWIALAVAGLTSAGLVVVAARARQARPALERTLDAALGTHWRAADGGLPRRSWVRTGLWPWPVRPRRIERLRNISYGPRDPENLLDIYRRRTTAGPSPVLVHLHGGGFRGGAKSREARALLHHVADLGWSSVSANYTLARSPAAALPQAAIDVKLLLAWLHETGPSHGLDPTRIVLTGSSAGAHLTAMATATVGDPRFQPGFEDAETSFAAAVGFYGYYGDVGGPPGLGSSPLSHDASNAPPFLAVHGTNDTYTPVEGARALVEHLRDGVDRAWLAELPGAQHSFDLFRSLRYSAVVDAVAVFAAAAVDRDRPGPGRPQPARAGRSERSI